MLALGERVDPARLGPIPANFEVRPYFPQPAVLRHAAVFLSHTGMNSTMEALLCEVPLVSYPQTPEQTVNGRRVEELGLGRVLTGPLDPRELRRTVDEVAADPAIRANLTRMARHLRAAAWPARRLLTRSRSCSPDSGAPCRVGFFRLADFARAERQPVNAVSRAQ